MRVEGVDQQRRFLGLGAERAHEEPLGDGDEVVARLDHVGEDAVAERDGQLGEDGREGLAGRRRRDEEAGPPDGKPQVRRSPLVERDVDDVRARDIRAVEPPVGQGHVAKGARDPRVDERAGGEPDPLHPAAFDRDPVETSSAESPRRGSGSRGTESPSMSVSSKPPIARTPEGHPLEHVRSQLRLVDGQRVEVDVDEPALLHHAAPEHAAADRQPQLRIHDGQAPKGADLELETLREAHVLDPVAPVVAQILGDRLGLGDGQRMTRRPFRVTHDTTIGEASASVPLGLTPRGRPAAARRSPAPRSAR